MYSNFAINTKMYNFYQVRFSLNHFIATYILTLNMCYMLIHSAIFSGFTVVYSQKVCT